MSDYIEHFRLAETFKDHLVPLPCNRQRHLQLNQVAPSPSQPNLDCFQRWGIHHLSGQPASLFYHPYYKKIIPLGLHRSCDTGPIYLPTRALHSHQATSFIEHQTFVLSLSYHRYEFYFIKIKNNVLVNASHDYAAKQKEYKQNKTYFCYA